ncbi:Zinc-finger domain of monoamine-oxidase A repressor R1 [Artemisia annua]|nr:Zinc-finger domain of monoamine-oxidase A repressor R1 [Artemisia annua]
MSAIKNCKRTMLNESGEAKEMKPRKRNKAPGVRVVGGRVYDSENGKTCHQCRQKTLDFTADCKNSSKGKPCTLKYCCTCLMNRYGEKAEEVAALEDWSCPRCRELCNCSFCMKKRGHNPTGALVQIAKVGGFSSVSDLLNVKGAENVGNYKIPTRKGASPRKQAASEEGNMITSAKKPGKENILDGKKDLIVIPPSSVQNPVEGKPKKMKRKALKVIHDVNGVNVATPNKASGTLNDTHPKDLKGKVLTQTHDTVVLKETSHCPGEKKLKKMKIEGFKEMPEQDADTVSKDSSGYPKKGITNEKVDAGIQQDVKAFEIIIHIDEDEQMANLHKCSNALDKQSDQNTKPCVNTTKHQNNDFKLHEKLSEAVAPLPTGTKLVKIAGVDIPKEEAGNALQFLEFCATFGEILNLRKGQGEVVVRELINGRSTRRGKYSGIVQFQIQLLSVIQEDIGSESPNSDTWLMTLKSCIPDSTHTQEAFACIDKKGGGYDHLNSSMKLRLLNFLCDEVLGTEKIRNWIDDQNVKFAEQKKEAREKLAAARDKEKCLKQKMQDDIAKAVIAKNGVPLTIQEHESLVSEIKKNTAQVHDEMLECKKMVPIDNKRPDAVRTEPIFRDNEGRVYWRLKGFSDKLVVLLQDIGTGDDTTESSESWFEFDAEQMNVIDKHINALR